MKRSTTVFSSLFLVVLLLVLVLQTYHTGRQMGSKQQELRTSRSSPNKSAVLEEEKEPFIVTSRTTTTKTAIEPSFVLQHHINGTTNSSRRDKPTIFSSSKLCHSEDFSQQPHASCWYQNMCIRRGEKWHKLGGLGGDESFDYLYVSDLPSDPPQPFTLGVGENRRAPELNIQPIRISVKEFHESLSSSSSSSVVHVNGTAVIWFEYIFSNFGHVLTDSLLPIFALMDSFMATPTPDVTILEFKAARPLGYNCDVQVTRPYVRRDPELLRSIVEDCTRFRRTMFPMITNKPVSLLADIFPANNSNDTVVCFDNLLVGYPFLGQVAHYYLDPTKEDTLATMGAPPPFVPLYFQGRQSQLWRFRLYTMQNLGVSDIAPPLLKNRIVIWNRAGNKRQLRQLPELAEFLRNRFESENVEVVLTDFRGMDLAAQVELMSGTTVHISGPGGGSFIGFYLPRGATQIRLYAADFPLDYQIFNALGYIHADYVSCSEQVATTTSAVLCGHSGSSSGMSFEYLSGLVQNALHRYQAVATAVL
jgi:Glycosyltransferase 61